MRIVMRPWHNKTDPSHPDRKEYTGAAQPGKKGEPFDYDALVAEKLGALGVQYFEGQSANGQLVSMRVRTVVTFSKN